MVFSDNVYNKLKFLAQIVLPALGTLYATVSGLMKWPNTEEVVGTVMAVDFFLGTILGLSTKSYNAGGGGFDGEFVPVEDPVTGDKVYTLDLAKNPEALQTQDKVVLKVNRS